VGQGRNGADASGAVTGEAAAAAARIDVCEGKGAQAVPEDRQEVLQAADSSIAADPAPIRLSKLVGR